MVSRQSFAVKARASRLLSVLLHEPGRLRLVKDAPQCCCANAATSDLKTPVGPARCRLKSAVLKAARQMAENREKQTSAGPKSNRPIDARTARIQSLLEGGGGRVKPASASSRRTVTGALLPIAPEPCR